MDNHVVRLIRFAEKWAAENEGTYPKEPKTPIQTAIDILQIFKANDIHIYYNKAFYFYIDGCYRYVSYEEALMIFNPIICTITDTGIYTSAQKKRKVMDELAHLQYPLLDEPKRHIVNFKTFAYDLEVNYRLPERRNLFFKYSLPFDVSRADDTKCPNFIKFINDVLDDEYRQFIINYIYCLFFPNIKLEVVPFFFGTGSNGKSTLIELIINLVGRDNCSFCSIDDLVNKSNSEYYLSQIEGKLLNVCADNSPMIKDEGKLKSLISKEPIMARQPYEGVRTIKDIPSFIFSFNKLPYLNDYSYGMLRKIVVVPFNKTFKQDTKLIERLMPELPQIFNYILKHADRGVLNGELVSETLRDKTVMYISSTDSVTLFLLQFIFKFSGDINIRELYNDYKIYCAENSHNRCNYETFKERLRKNKIEFSNRYIKKDSIQAFKMRAVAMGLKHIEVNDGYDIAFSESKNEGIFTNDKELDF